MKNLSFLGWLAVALVIIGALNWGLVGAFQLDLVATLFGESSMLSRIVYSLVGLGAVYGIFMVMKMRNYTCS
jgi:uncharacterized membrane protein YuzA (DUF378 family)